MKSLIAFIAVFGAGHAWAFPEMVRHGYTQCTACHVSPAGGGVLNKYGRELASELLSTWSYQDESQFLHSKIGKDLAEKGYLFGGDVRYINTYIKDSDHEKSHAFFMMADLQTAYQTGLFTGVVSVGQLERQNETGIHGNFNSTEYYGLARFSDELGIRAGRFMPAYGINFPDHTLFIKEMIGFIPAYQFDSVEASYLGERWTVLATAARTTPQTRTFAQESVRTLNVSYALFDSVRVGGSYWGGSGPLVDRHFWGLNGILGFTKQFYNMTEVDFEYQSDHNSLFAISQLGYEVYKGITPYLQYQRSQDDLTDKSTLTNDYGVGCHFYPRPHFELSAQWDHIRSADLWSDQAYILGHYYF